MNHSSWMSDKGVPDITFDQWPFQWLTFSYKHDTDKAIHTHQQQPNIHAPERVFQPWFGRIAPRSKMWHTAN